MTLPTGQPHDEERPLRTVLLLGRFGPPLLTFARSCGRAGVRAFLLEVAKAGEPVSPKRLSRHLVGGETLPPDALGTTEGLSRVRTVVDRIGADAIVAGSDAHLLWLGDERRLLEPACRVLMPPSDRLRGILSKEAQLNLARTSGFELLPTFVLRTVASAQAMPSDAYPLCLRPATADAIEPSFKVHLARDHAELESLLSGLQVWRDSVIAQPFVDAPSLVVHGARAETGRTLALECFRVDRKFEGLALTVRPGPLLPDVERSCRSFVEAAGITGVFHFDLVGPTPGGKVFFLEINVRIGGTTDKVYRLGFDEPRLHLESYGFLVNGPTRQVRSNRTVANKRMLVKHLVCAARGGLTPFDYPGGSRLAQFMRSAVDLVRTRDSVFDRNDLAASLRFHLRPPSA